MRFSIPAAIALLAASSSALAQMPPPRHYDNGDGSFHPADDASAVDGPGNGLQLELNVFRLSTVYSTNALYPLATFTGTGTGAGSLAASYVGTLEPLVLVGYQFDQNALMLGVGVAQIASTTYFGVTPTYRRYMSPLRTGKISAFGEAGVTISVVAPSGSTFWGLGIDVGGGAEWLFVKNFGLFGKALITYGHVSNGSGSPTSPSNLDAAGIEGDVGLTLHL